MLKKSDLADEDVLNVLDLIWKQLGEDRELILEVHNDLKVLMKGDPTQYAVSGIVLAKYAELLTKQTGQTIDLLKILHKNKQKDDSLSEEEMKEINKAIEDE